MAIQDRINRALIGLAIPALVALGACSALTRESPGVAPSPELTTAATPTPPTPTRDVDSEYWAWFLKSTERYSDTEDNKKSAVESAHTICNLLNQGSAVSDLEDSNEETSADLAVYILGAAKFYCPKHLAAAEANYEAAKKAKAEAQAKAAAKKKAAEDKAAEEKAAKEKAAKEKAEKKINNAQTVGPRTLAKIFKDPDRYKGEVLVVYGQVTQFDSATGTDAFRADVANRNTMSYGFFNGDNAMLTGEKSELEDLVEDDVFRATVTVSGSYSYDTQIGGNTTVPLFKVNKIKVIS
jgi:hypothetical protein